jgi:hypothetical protein
MSVLFEELDRGVTDSLDGVVPEVGFSNITVHHESLHLLKMKEIIEKIGGRVSGEYV